MPQTCSHGQDKPVKPPVATSQHTKHKGNAPKKLTDKELAAAQEAELAVRKWLAELEVARTCDNNLPTPHPQSKSQRSSTLSQTNSQAEISALVAQQRHASKEVAGGSGASGTTEPSGWLFNNNSLTDKEDHQIPIKKLRRVIVPDPVTPVAAKVQRPTVVQKQDAERAKEDVKKVERLAKEDAKVKKAAERQAKAQAKEDKRERKAEEKREKAREKVRVKEAKEQAKKAKKMKVQDTDSQDKNMNTSDSNELPSTLTDTKANAAGKDDNTREQKKEIGSLRRKVDQAKVDQATVATVSKVSLHYLAYPYLSSD